MGQRENNGDADDQNVEANVAQHVGKHLRERLFRLCISLPDTFEPLGGPAWQLIGASLRPGHRPGERQYHHGT